MSDNATAGGVAAGEQEPVAATQEPSAGAIENTSANSGGLAGLADADSSGGEPVSPADWPADWRERLAGGNDDALRALKRYGSVDGLWKKIANQEKLLSDRSQHRVPQPLPENATEEQVAEYRKAIGIPETPDGYGVQFAPEVGADEKLNGMLQGFLSYAHERNIPPGAVKAAVEWQQNEILRQRDAADAAAQRAVAEVSRTLRSEYGADYERNKTIAREFIEARPGLKRAIASMPMADIEVTRDLVALALDLAPEDRLYDGDSASGGKSLDDQIEEYKQKSIRGKLSKSEDQKYMRLLEARMKRDERNNRAA